MAPGATPPAAAVRRSSSTAPTPRSWWPGRRWRRCRKHLGRRIQRRPGRLPGCLGRGARPRRRRQSWRLLQHRGPGSDVGRCGCWRRRRRRRERRRRGTVRRRCGRRRRSLHCRPEIHRCHRRDRPSNLRQQRARRGDPHPGQLTSLTPCCCRGDPHAAAPGANRTDLRLDLTPPINQDRTPTPAMGYFIVVILQTIALPLICGTIELATIGGNPIEIYGRWWVFWGIGTRLLLAGAVQLSALTPPPPFSAPSPPTPAERSSRVNSPPPTSAWASPVSSL